MAYIVRNKSGEYILSIHEPIKIQNKWTFSHTSYFYIDSRIADILLNGIKISFHDKPIFISVIPQIDNSVD